jgi:trk system potassium uptake protein TrkA
MNITIVGCGRLGAQLAYRLYQKGHKVTVIDQVANAFNNLPPDFVGRTIEGEAMDEDVLNRADIKNSEGVAVVTNSDPLNAVIAHVIRVVYGINNVVVRNYDPSLRVIHEAFNSQIISSTSWGAQRLEELLVNADMRAIFSAGNGEVEIYEVLIPPQWDGHPLGELLSDCNCIPVSLTRAGAAMLPRPDTRLYVNDYLLVSATFEGIEGLRIQLHARQEV